MDGPKLRLRGGPLDHRPFGRLSFVYLDGPNYAIWTKEPSSNIQYNLQGIQDIYEFNGQPVNIHCINGFFYT